MARSIADLLDADVETTESDPSLLDIESEAADEAFRALASNTARSLLVALQERPRTTSALAEELDTSIQNVHHHLGNLRDADLVEPAGSTYSEKGAEMTVYAPASDPLVITAAPSGVRERLRRTLREALGAVALLASLGVLFRRTVARGVLDAPAPVARFGAAPDPTAVAPPAVAAFAAATLASLVCWQAWRRRTPGRGRRAGRRGAPTDPYR